MTTIAAGLGALTTLKRMGNLGLGAGKPTKLEDRGDYWIITYDDGTTEQVPKDLAKIQNAMQTAHANGQTELEQKYAMWIQNIQSGGKPVETSFFSEHPVLTVTAGVVTGGALVGLIWYLVKHH